MREAAGLSIAQSTVGVVTVPGRETHRTPAKTGAETGTTETASPHAMLGTPGTTGDTRMNLIHERIAEGSPDLIMIGNEIAVGLLKSLTVDGVGILKSLTVDGSPIEIAYRTAVAMSPLEIKMNPVQAGGHASVMKMSLLSGTLGGARRPGMKDHLLTSSVIGLRGNHGQY
jgi:hypothetical protein